MRTVHIATNLTIAPSTGEPSFAAELPEGTDPALCVVHLTARVEVEPGVDCYVPAALVPTEDGSQPGPLIGCTGAPNGVPHVFIQSERTDTLTGVTAIVETA